MSLPNSVFSAVCDVSVFDEVVGNTAVVISCTVIIIPFGQ